MDGLLNESRARLSIINVECSPIINRNADVMVSAKGVMPREPVDKNRRLVFQKAEYLSDHLQITADHSVRVDDPSRHAGGTGGEQNLRNVVRANPRVGRLDVGARSSSQDLG